MAEPTAPLHGAPVDVGSRSHEDQAKAVVDVNMELRFNLDLTRFGGTVIHDVIPPARVIARVADLFMRGPDALKELPTIPQPNSLWGRLLPPPKGGKKK